MIFEALRGLLLADQALNTLTDGRITFMQAPAGGAYPDIVQYPSSGSVETTLEGSAPPWNRRISFECRAMTYAAAHTVGDHVLRVLQNYRGAAGGENIQGLFVASDVPLIDETSAVKRRVIDFTVHHSPL